ncbi:hypothetical protein HA402_008836 [Bradysia odoriphaga]|nr:hypothetical protein HA402_008836 [Bradysia odoriphaga]
MISVKNSLYLTTVIAVAFIHMQFISAGVNRVNHLTFERFQCFANKSSGVTIPKCVLKLIDRNHVRVDLELVLNRTVKSIFFQYKVFYQISTNEFKPFIDVVEDFCGYMKGDFGNLVLDRIMPLVRNLTSTNLNHPCPYKAGKLFIKKSNLSVSWMSPEQFSPSGRYRLEMSCHEGYQGPMMGRTVGYGSISDHRIEQF